jgi:hypothetical protein
MTQKISILVFSSLVISILACTAPFVSGVSYTNVVSLPSDDSYVDSSGSLATHGSDTTLSAGYYNPLSSFREYWALIKFNLTGRPAGYERCLLQVYVSGGMGSPLSLTLNLSATFVISDEWSEGTVTWNDRPATATLIDLGQLIITSSSSTGPHTFDVTTFVNTVISYYPSSNITFCLHPADLSYNCFISIASKENSYGADRTPSLLWQVPQQDNIGGYEVILVAFSTLIGVGIANWRGKSLTRAR